jgi:alpha-ribazole phosphatase
MTQLLLVRHGETDWNREGRYQGRADQPLNAIGLAQAKTLAEQLAGRSVCAVYSSDLGRAVETAQIIARNFDLNIQIDPRLREVNQGQWEGLLASDIPNRYPVEWWMRREDPVHARPPGGETVAEVAARVWAAADDIVRHHPNGSVLIVSHGLAIATLLCKASGVPLERAYHLAPANGSLETIQWPGEWP